MKNIVLKLKNIVLKLKNIVLSLKPLSKKKEREDKEVQVNNQSYAIVNYESARENEPIDTWVAMILQENSTLKNNDILFQENITLEVKNEKLLKDLENFEEMAKMPNEELEQLKKLCQNADSKFDFKRYMASKKAKGQYKTALAQEIAQRVTLQHELKAKASASQETNEEEDTEAIKFEKTRRIIKEIESKLPEEDEERVPKITIKVGKLVVETDSEHSAVEDDSEHSAVE